MTYLHNHDVTDCYSFVGLQQFASVLSNQRKTDEKQVKVTSASVRRLRRLLYTDQPTNDED